MALYAFDGTWNVDSDDDGVDTNVVRFKELYQGQDVEYLEGVGTRMGVIGKVMGGVFGIGGRSRIEEMYDALVENWENDDKDIDIIGFSRGAALAVHFANQIGKEGIKLSDGTKLKPQIRFLGVWDVVGSFGLSLDTMIDFQNINLGWDIDTISGCVQHCYHAMVLDERRESFGITRLDASNEKDNVTEVWFRGVHSDIGGGNNNTDRSNIALNWMLDKARECGVGINESKARMKKYSQTDVKAKISENRDPSLDDRRKVSLTDTIHPTAKPLCLEVGDAVEFSVDSALKYNWSGVRLKKGQQYRITADKNQVWTDDDIECGPAGWPTEDLAWYKETVVGWFEDNRRFPEANWFELIGACGDSDDHVFRISAEHTFTATQNADLYTFANDLNSTYGNNKGSIIARIQRLS